MTTNDSALHALITDALKAKGWGAAHLHRALAERGVSISFSAVYLWTKKRGGIHDRHRPALADALGVSMEQVARAAAGLDPRDSAGA